MVLATALWGVMFSPLTAPHVPFWGMMSLSAGAGIAAGLWGVFWAGDQISSLLFDFARPQVDSIYNMKEGTPAWLLSALLLLWIGPAEELFWRGYVQRRLTQQWNPNAGFAVTALVYALVHAPSCNFMLVMAAGVAGVVWGGIYRFFPQRLGALVVSHALWDAAVFVWFPIG